MATAAKQIRLDALHEIYTSPENAGAYGGIERLYRVASKDARLNGLSRDEVKAYLSGEYTYTMHRPARKHFARNPTYVKGIDSQWQADLADLHSISADNDGVKYLLTVIDVFSKYAWAIPVKEKSSQAMVKAFEQLFTQTNPRIPIKLHTDKGSEFLNKQVQAVFRKYGVQHFCSDSDMKAAVAERFNRTLKTLMWRYFTDKQTKRYIDILPDLLHSYNQSFHRSIRMRPVDVRKENEVQVWRNLYRDGGKLSEVKDQMIPAQLVRISKVKGDFEKGYVPNWTGEHFTVSGKVDLPKTLYKLQDKSGEEIQGSWYREEIQPISKNKFIIEKIVRTRKRPDGQREVLVKWKNWSPKFNTWILEAEAKNGSRSTI